MKGVPTDAGAEERLVARKEVNEELRGIQNLDESFDFFEILGEEFCLTFGPNLGFQDWDEPDLTVCLELKDKERFQAWLSAATPTYELKKKVSHGVEYVAVTKTHDWQSNLYALYEGDFVHLTTYQPAVERLCQQSSESRTDVAWFDSQWVGSTHNVMFRADLRHSPSFLSDVLDPSRTYQGRKQMRHAVGAAVDRMLARRSLSPEEVSAFFRFTPDSLYGIPITEKDGRIFLGEVPAEDIDLESYQVPPKDEAKGADVPQLWDLVEKYRDPQTVKKIQLFEQASVGMSFTPEGLSTRVSLNNPAYNPASLPVVADRARAVMWGIAGLTAVLASLLVFLRRKKQPPRQDVVS